MSKFLTVKSRIGRTGNQMFIMASAMGIAKKNDFEFGLPDYDPIAGIKSLSPLIATKNYIEPRFEYDEVILDKGFHWNIHNSYLQSYKYFDHCWEEIKHYFSRIQLHAQAQEYIKEVSADRIPVSIHVRRTDYMTLPQYHPFVGLEYLNKAMSHFDENTHQFIITTDDYIWASENVRAKHIVVTGKDVLLDLHIGANCYHNILANSSFSWWQAWLNENIDKKVIAPLRWFGEAYANKSIRDLIPKDWIQI